MQRIIGIIGFSWGTLGICWLLVGAILRLSEIGLQMFDQPLATHHWLALVFMVLFMAYSEGYRGFQLSFSPRTAARLKYILDNPNVREVLLAPLFGMCFYHTTRARFIGTSLLMLMILCFIVGAQFLPQPWRGILDFGVVVGLAWGTISLLYFCGLALFSTEFSYSPELPHKASSD